MKCERVFHAGSSWYGYCSYLRFKADVPDWGGLYRRDRAMRSKADGDRNEQGRDERFKEPLATELFDLATKIKSISEDIIPF